MDWGRWIPLGDIDKDIADSAVILRTRRELELSQRRLRIIFVSCRTPSLLSNMSPARLLQRNIRPAKTGRGDEDFNDENGADLSDEEVATTSENEDSVDGSSDDGGQSQEDEIIDDDQYERQISNVSFGALKQAQEQLQRKRKRGSENTLEQEQKLDALRERLQHIKNSKASNGQTKKHSRSTSLNRGDQTLTTTSTIEHNLDEFGDSDFDSDSAPSEEGAGNRSRTSKHAPATQSSKHQVSRRRTVIAVPQRRFRDPRFDALAPRNTPGGGGAGGHSSEQAYGFLREYQQAEVAELKEAARKTKDADEREKLRRAAGRIENRLQARAAQERTREVVRRHRRAERERIAEGKTPFFLKKKEIRERALVDKFAGMKPKDRERLMERRQKKEGQKEKKRMPNARRVVG